MEQTYDSLKDGLSEREKNKLKDLKNEKIEDARKEAETKFIRKMERNEKHDTIVGKISRAFLPSSDISKLYDETGYEFVTYEPLFAISRDIGGTISDVLLCSKEKSKLLTLEVKTSSARRPIKKLNEVKETFKKNKERLNEIIPVDIDESSILFILVVDEYHRATELADKCHEKDYSLWIFENEQIKLHPSSTTRDDDLDEILEEGYHIDVGDAIYITPNSENYRIAKNVLMDLFQEKSRDGGANPKVFTKEEFINKFLGLTHIDKDTLDKDSKFYNSLFYRMNEVIEEAESKGVIKRMNSEKYKIYTKGKRDEEPIIKGIERKWLNEFIEKNYERIAKKNAVELFEKKKREEKSLDEYL